MKYHKTRVYKIRVKHSVSVCIRDRWTGLQTRLRMRTRKNFTCPTISYLSSLAWPVCILPSNPARSGTKIKGYNRGCFWPIIRGDCIFSNKSSSVSVSFSLSQFFKGHPFSEGQFHIFVWLYHIKIFHFRTCIRTSRIWHW